MPIFLQWGRNKETIDPYNGTTIIMIAVKITIVMMMMMVIMIMMTINLCIVNVGPCPWPDGRMLA